MFDGIATALPEPLHAPSFNDLLADLHATYRPTSSKVRADDIPQATVGKMTAEVSGRTSAIAKTFVHGLQALGCTMSNKSLLYLLSTSVNSSRGIQEGLRKAGIAVRAGTTGKDLGVDVHHVRRRRILTQKKRLGLASKRLARICPLMKVDRKDQTLATTGAWPQGKLGVEASGCAVDVAPATRQNGRHHGHPFPRGLRDHCVCSSTQGRGQESNGGHSAFGASYVAKLGGATPTRPASSGIRHGSPDGSGSITPMGGGRKPLFGSFVGFPFGRMNGLTRQAMSGP
jgi:hypothetical protein